MRLCINCEHYHYNEAVEIARDNPHECHRKISLVTGEPAPKNCEVERNSTSTPEKPFCGADAAFFVARKTR